VRGSDDNVSNVRWRPPAAGSAEAYAIATVLVVIASLVRWGLGLLTDDAVLPFTTYYPAVLFAALIGGAAVGTYAAVLGGVIAWWAFLPPQFALLPLKPGHQINLLTYLLAALVIVWGADRYRRISKRLEDEEGLRKLAVEELAHRMKNKLATIHSIINYQLRQYPQIRAAILGRLDALSATDDLIMSAQGSGAYLQDILSTELHPYETSRVTMAGPQVFLSPKLALTFALLFHELATNAAKYGALSSSAGKLSIAWSLSRRTLELEWRERGGPPITSPTRRGFGERLLSRALGQFGGTVETMFEPAGLTCKMTVNLGDDAPGIVSDVKPAVDEVIVGE